MTAQKMRGARVEAATVDEASALDPLLAKPIPHAYALIPDPDRPMRFYAVHLSNVTAEKLDHLELGSRSGAATYGMGRIELAMQRRHVSKGWSK